MVLGDMDAGGLERTAEAIMATGAEALTVVGDLTEEDTASRLIQTAVDGFGQLDILVNNVGGSRNAKIWEMSVEDWDFVLRLNLRSTFLCTKHAVRQMMQQRRGKIVCISSGAREGTPWTAYYQGAPPTRLRRLAYTVLSATWRWNWPNTASTSMPSPPAPSTPNALAQTCTT
jgi:NAD(P)-dependent dehydrogenase (short-subunit alcohol dehydrogenase family)